MIEQLAKLFDVIAPRYAGRSGVSAKGQYSGPVMDEAEFAEAE